MFALGKRFPDAAVFLLIAQPSSARGQGSRDLSRSEPVSKEAGCSFWEKLAIR